MIRRISRQKGLFTPELFKTALVQAFIMLRPDILWKVPPMFMAEIAAIFQIAHTLAKALGYPSETSFAALFAWDMWLLFTLLIVNFATALTEAREKAQADAWSKKRQEQ